MEVNFDHELSLLFNLDQTRTLNLIHYIIQYNKALKMCPVQTEQRRIFF